MPAVMRYFTLLAGVLSLASVVRCRSTSHIEPARVENLRRVPEGWTEVGAPEQNRRLHFRIAVRQPDHALLERTLMEISDPSHHRYGQHLTRDEAKELVRPRAESSAAVMSWLQESDIPAEDIENDGEWITFYTSVGNAEKMMHTDFKTYQNRERRDVEKIRALGYSVPLNVRDHIDLISPTTYFGEIRAHVNHVHDFEVLKTSVDAKLASTMASANIEAVNATCNRSITPACLAELYNFGSWKGSPNVSTTIGVSGYLGQYARYKDWALFTSLWAPNAQGSNFTWTSVNGGLNDQNSHNNSVEAQLDIQYTLGLVAPAVKVNYYSTPGRGPLIPDVDQPKLDNNQNEPYLEYFTYMNSLSDDELPDVLTTSYGESEQSVPPPYARKVCDLIGQLGTRGVSVIFSSGDTGVGSSCLSNDGNNQTKFIPIFPASCPYVTAVGGTVRVDPEEAVDFSSGGFSELFPRPSYQDVAVKSYLHKLGDQWSGLYNPSGRGFPDVAAQGQFFRVIDQGRQSSVSGTSASSPVFASVIAMINNNRKVRGKANLGFLNPWIYSQGYRGLNDVVSGGSTGCTGRSIYSGLQGGTVEYASWNATSGWDPVTGYGTPNYEKLLAISEAGVYGQVYGRRRVRRGGM